jgi:hypothetical protein
LMAALSLQKVSLRPWRAGFAQSLAESSVIALAVLVLTVPLRLAGWGGSGVIAISFALLGSLLWSVWRLAAVSSQSWAKRFAIGIVRAFAFGAALGCILFALLDVFQLRKAFGQIVVSTITIFLVARLVMVVVRRSRAVIQRRLRWQLTLSHLAVILLTFVSMTSVGTFVGIIAAYAALAPQPTGMAESTAEVLHPLARNGAINRFAAKTLIDEILDRRVIVTGEFPFAIFGANPAGPSSIVVVNSAGRVIASGISQDLPKSCAQRLTADMSPSRVARLRAGTTTRSVIEVPIRCPLASVSNGIGRQGEAIAAAPIFDRGHHRVGFVAIEATS